jgi:hypothetical protein
MLRKTAVILAALTIAGAAASTDASAQARWHGGGGHVGGFHGGGAMRWHGGAGARWHGGWRGGHWRGGYWRGGYWRGPYWRGGWGWGWGWPAAFGVGWGLGYYGAYGYPYYYGSCYRPVRVWTHYGWRWRRVWVCG